jgi:hypothetical protein
MRKSCFATVALHRVFTSAGLLLLLLASLPPTSLHAQTTPAPPASPAANTKSFAEVLRSHKHPLHILYVHGIGDDGIDDYDSYYLRRGICQTLHCTQRDGELNGKLVFADKGQFRAHATPPSLSFLGQVVFPVDSTGGSELWDASTPFLRRYTLINSGAPVYVDELNWWPLVFALKCRYVVAPDAALVGADTTTLNDCSRARTPYGDTGHFTSYPYISPDEKIRLENLPKRGALLNRKLKGSLLDWGFTDAILSLGPMRQVLLDGLRQLIQLATQPQDGDSAESLDSQEFIIVTHSLGSYLIFAAFDAPGSADSDPALSYVLGRTSRVYFFANQLRLLEMANLDVARSSNVNQHLAGWVSARTSYLASVGQKVTENPPQIIAWNDASDLLTWEVPSICGIVVENHTVRNSFNWFGLAEGPTKAHDYYGLNQKVIRGVLNASSHTEPPPCPAGSGPVSAAAAP